MLYLITGGSGSGKSEYAEKVAADRFRLLEGKGQLYYVATMYPYDEESHKRIERHRRMRNGKGFVTVECFSHLEQVKAGKQDVILLECMSNLLANEMYLEQGRIKGNGNEAGEQMKAAILKPVLQLEKTAGGVVVVTNEVFSDGMEYEEETEKYCNLLGGINRQLGESADCVVEVVCSIPVRRKGEMPC